MGLIGQAVSEMFETNDNIHVYSPGTGADNLRSFFSLTVLFRQNFVLCCKFSSIKRLCNSFSHSNVQVTQFDLEVGQGEPRVIIYINFVELDSPMIHAKFQDHRTSGSGEEDFKKYLSYMGMAAIFVM